MDKREAEKIKNKLSKLAWFMDNSIRIPGTQLRFGLDGLIGLIPGVGDILGALISSHIISQAVLLGTPISILLKMVFNVGFDALLGAIPVIGDISDFIWKANQKNIILLNAYIVDPKGTTTYSRFFIGMLGFCILGLIVMIGIFSLLLLRWLWYSAYGS